MKSYYKLRKTIPIKNNLLEFNQISRNLIILSLNDDMTYNLHYFQKDNENMTEILSINENVIQHYLSQNVLYPISEDAFIQETHIMEIEKNILKSDLNTSLKTKLLKSLNQISKNYCKKYKINWKKLFFKDK